MGAIQKRPKITGLHVIPGAARELLCWKTGYWTAWALNTAAKNPEPCRMQYVITVHTQQNPASHWLAWWQPRGALVILAFEALQQLFTEWLGRFVALGMWRWGQAVAHRHRELLSVRNWSKKASSEYRHLTNLIPRSPSRNNESRTVPCNPYTQSKCSADCEC